MGVSKNVFKATFPICREAPLCASIVLVLVADEVQLAGPDLMGEAPMLERLLSSMSDPDLGGLELADGHGQFVPIGMIGYDQRKLDVALACALADPHPA